MRALRRLHTRGAPITGSRAPLIPRPVQRNFALGLVMVLLLPVVLAVAILLRSDGYRHTYAAPLAGAIFTTTPDGGIVNENTHYTRKIEVYLDGGPGPNAPQHAAGLPDGDYYFQVTDPPGKVLLSEDPAKCRKFHVQDGIIVSLLNVGATYDPPGPAGPFPCHTQDAPNPPNPASATDAGASGRHDTNTDKDHGPPAIVIQLMPFFDTPNNGGVYKAWIVPADRYVANGGDPNVIPSVLKVKGQQVGYGPDRGFGPPRDQVKTDNFKVKEVVPPAVLRVRKFHDVNGDGIWQQATEPEIGKAATAPVKQCVDDSGNIEASCTNADGWPVWITDPIPVTNPYHTPTFVIAEPPGQWSVLEETFSPKWAESVAYRDSASLGAVNPVTVTVAGTASESHEVVFGNYMPIGVRGQKFIDSNANGTRDGGEGCPSNSADVNFAGCVDVTVHLDGADNAGHTVHLTTKTCGASLACPAGQPNGSYSFSGLRPGTYAVTIDEPASFQCSFPASCRYDFTILSGDSKSGLDFGDFAPAEIHGIKFFDQNGDGVFEPATEAQLADVEIHLDGTDGLGNPVHLKTFTCGGAQVPDCLGHTIGTFWFTGLRPGTYTVSEVVPTGFIQTFPAPPGVHVVTLTSNQLCDGKDFGNVGRCAGLTPGYWRNWRNHYTRDQFLTLLQGTIAQGSIANADTYLTSVGCDNGDAILCMRRFLLSDQLTLNLTQHPELPNPSNGNLIGLCRISGIGSLQNAVQQGLQILANPNGFSRDQVLAAKDKLAAFAQLGGG